MHPIIRLNVKEIVEKRQGQFIELLYFVAEVKFELFQCLGGVSNASERPHCSLVENH